MELKKWIKKRKAEENLEALKISSAAMDSKYRLELFNAYRQDLYNSGVLVKADEKLDRAGLNRLRLVINKPK